MPAAPPKKATNKVTLGFGLVSIPCKIYSGVDDKAAGIKRSEYVRVDGELHKAGRAVIDKETGEIISSSDVVKMFDTNEKGLVELSDDEIESVLQPENGAAVIESFIPLHFLGAGTYVPAGVGQIRPDGADKAFALLMAGMRRRQVFGLVKVTARNQIRYMALLPTGRLYALLFDEEVRDDLPLPPAQHDEGEMEFAIELIESKTAEKPPVLSNDSLERVREYALEKAENGGEAPVIEQSKPEKATDLLAALQASVEASKKQS